MRRATLMFLSVLFLSVVLGTQAGMADPRPSPCKTHPEYCK
ncbi:MAG: hypothetical protein U9R74_08885 [Pseudomonadota bacterium]|nr:hypothetical protein [Pseudomonadota bacterium]